jgi:hypothetical protein
MRLMADNSIDSIVTDPPYGLGFMGKEWDSLPPGLPWAAECLRVLKPGGHLLAFGGSRTWHRLAVAVEDAGFEMRDSIAWLYGSGFPKSLDVSKAIDKAAGAMREVTGRIPGARNGNGNNVGFGPFTPAADGMRDVTAPATDAAREWEGWGTALKPAFEPIVVARKPLGKGMTVAANVLAHGTGALNIDGSRIHSAGSEATQNATGKTKQEGATFEGETKAGRWPANVILDESQAATLDAQSGTSKSVKGDRGRQNSGQHGGLAGAAANMKEGSDHARGHDDQGGASRFFYVAKAPASERPNIEGVAHPTVKPLALMRYLVRLVTPPNGIMLDPFAGSGTTIEAAIDGGFRSIGIESTDDYLPLILHRIARAEGIL